MSGSPTRLRARIAAAPPAARSRVLVDFVLQQLRDELGIETTTVGEELHPRSRFESLGVDSKRALEFKELLEEELDCSLSTTLLFDYPTPEALAAYVVKVAFGDEGAPSAPAGTIDAGGADHEDRERDGGEGDAAASSIEERLRKKLEAYDV